MRKILELNLYGQPIYIDLNLVCVIGQVERYYPNTRASLTGHCGFTIRLNISAPFSTNNEYIIYFGFNFEEGLKIDPPYPFTPSEKSPMVEKLHNRVTDIKNQMVDIWSGKIPGNNFVIQLSMKDLV